MSAAVPPASPWRWRWAQTKLDILLLESGGANFDPAAQSLYSGVHAGDTYAELDAGRMRFLGGGTNHWGGWCRPLDPQSISKSATGCPIPVGRSARGAGALLPARAGIWCEAGPWIYDQRATAWRRSKAPMLQLGQGGIYTSWFQFSEDAQ